MSVWVPARLRPLLGTDLAAVDASLLGNLVGVTEGQELDFKSEMYGKTDADRKELAYDVAQFANTAGGLLVIGIEEDGQGAAVGLTPLDFDDEPGLWVDQVVASRIFPRPALAALRIDVEEGAVLLISVPPSRQQPHSVDVGGGGLRYPARGGSHRYWLSEAEIAERYARRLRNVAEAESRLDAVNMASLEAIPEHNPEYERVMLVLAAAPDEPGQLELRRGLPEERQELVRAEIDRFPSYGRPTVLSAVPGFRSIRLGGHGGPNFEIEGYGGELRLDGSGYLQFYTHVNARDDGSLPVYDEHVFGDLMNGLRLLALHAAQSGSLGALNIKASIVAPGTSDLVLFEYRSDNPFRDPIRGTTALAQPAPASLRSFTIDSMVDDPESLIAAARLIASDLFSAFGLVEPLQVDTDGHLRRAGFQQAWHGQLAAWAAEHGVDLV